MYLIPVAQAEPGLTYTQHFLCRRIVICTAARSLGALHFAGHERAFTAGRTST
jgi:hypothetical protein